MPDIIPEFQCFIEDGGIMQISQSRLEPLRPILESRCGVIKLMITRG